MNDKDNETNNDGIDEETIFPAAKGAQLKLNKHKKQQLWWIRAKFKNVHFNKDKEDFLGDFFKYEIFTYLTLNRGFFQVVIIELVKRIELIEYFFPYCSVCFSLYEQQLDTSTINKLPTLMKICSIFKSREVLFFIIIM